MPTATKSAISMMRSDGTIKTFVTFRIAGDSLVPDEVTQLLKAKPAHAHKKGEAYTTGRSNIVPATGVWLFRTDQITISDDFYLHLQAALLLLGFLPQPAFAGSRSTPSFDVIASALRLKDFLESKSLKATLTCFWHGRRHADRPAIPPEIDRLFSLIPIEIAVDFDLDAESPVQRRHKAA